MPSLVFMGSDPIALPGLTSLAETPGVDLVAVFTQPDRKRGRGQRVVPNAIKEWATERGVPVRQPEKVGPEEAQWLRDQQVDAVLVMAYGHILKQDLLAAPRSGCLNLHASLLPELRGASPIETAIATGQTATGVSLMRIIKKMDAGAVADQETVVIDASDTAADLRTKIAQACVPLLQRNLSKMLDGTLEFSEQDDSRATYCRMLAKDDGALDFALPARDLHDRIRAFRDWPGAFFTVTDTRLKVGRASSQPENRGSAPGTIHEASSDALPVSTGDGTLLLHELQRPGGKRLPVSEFLLGFPLPPGTVATSQTTPPLVFDQPYRRPKTV